MERTDICVAMRILGKKSTVWVSTIEMYLYGKQLAGAETIKMKMVIYLQVSS